MRKLTRFFVLVAATLVFGSCQTGPSATADDGNLLRNGSAEIGPWYAVSWLLSGRTGATQTTTFEEAYDGKKSFRISASSPTFADSSWAQNVTVFPLDKALTFEAYIKTEAVHGPGVILQVSVYDTTRLRVSTEPIAYFSTPESEAIVGTTGWLPYRLELPPGLPAEAKLLRVRMTLVEGSTGTVYFDKVSLRVR